MRYRVHALMGFVLILGAWSCTKAPEATVTGAPAAATPPTAEDVETTIVQLEKEWVAAIEKKDTGTLDRLIADEFVGTSPSAHTYTKLEATSDLKSGTYVVEKMELDEVSANVYGNGTTAVSFTSQEEKSTYAGTNTSGHYHFTDVWVKKDGRWEVVASHGTRYDEPTAKEKGK